MYFMFFFFKQKTAYEMRISDWSSDVCSSDLAVKVAEAESFTIGQSYERAVDLIMAAKGNVTVVGGRFSRHVAGMLASYLAQLRPGISAQDILSVESFDSLPDMGRRAVLVVFDYRRHQTNELGRASCRERVGQYV